MGDEVNEYGGIDDGVPGEGVPGEGPPPDSGLDMSEKPNGDEEMFDNDDGSDDRRFHGERDARDGRGGGNRPTGFSQPWGPGPDFGGPPGPNWRGPPNRGFRGGPPGPPRFMRGGPPMGPGGPPGQFGGPRMRGRGGFGGPMGPNGYGPPMRGGRGGFGPRGPPGWGDPSFHGGPPGMGGPPPGMMGPHGGPGHWGGPPGDEMGHPRPGGDNPLGIDLSGEVWVETKTEEGKSYFYNARTRETTWSRPEEGPGVRVLTQSQVEQLTQQLASGEGKPQKGPESDGYGMPPAYMGGPQGFMPPGGHAGGPPHAGGPGAPFGVPPPGFAPPWGAPGVMQPPWASGPPGHFADTCDWSEHTSPDGKKYYYNAKTGESVWEKPKEFADFEKRKGGGPGPVPAVSAPAKLDHPTISVAPVNGKMNDEKISEDKNEFAEVTTKAATVKKDTFSASTTTTPAAAATPADKSKPVSSVPVQGTPWCVVWTGDNRVFFYNPTSKTSVWERPPDLVGRADVTEMMKSPAAAEKVKAKQSAGGGRSAESDSESEDETSKQRNKKAAAKKPEPQIIFQDELNKQKQAAESDGDLLKKGSIDVGKEAAMEAEVRAAKERQLVPLETRMNQFRELLTEKEISAFSTWEKELHKIVFDPRYLLLTSKERKQVFEKYVKERAEEERREKKNRMREKRDQFTKFLEECNITTKMSFSEFSNKYGKDERFKGIEKSRERESLFNEYLLELRRREKEERIAKREQARKDFQDLLKESDFIDRHSSWSDVKKKLESDPRYKAIESSRDREDYFSDYIHDLKDEHRRAKERKKSKRSRSRSRSRGRKKSRSRSRERKKKKKRSKSSDDDSPRKKSKLDKEEGEMSEDDDEHSKKRKKDNLNESVDEEMSDAEKKDKKEKKSESDIDNDKDEDEKKSSVHEDGDEADAEERARREKEERVAASLRKRQEEVEKELSSHLHARDKEREHHRHAEAVSNFQALLTDLIRQPDFSWKEAKKVLKKDSRYEMITENLEKSERERLFDEHIDTLVTKKKENFRKMLDECKSITLESSFKEIKKLIRDDPRYSKYSSSDRKCEKQFNEYMKDRMAQARMAFKQLLMETKKITDKSYQLVNDKESGHLQEIEEVLSLDRRYLDLDGFKDERTNILMDYLEEVERRGPPPPPTASEPNRRKL